MAGKERRYFLLRGGRPGDREEGEFGLWAGSSRRTKEFTPKGPDFL